MNKEIDEELENLLFASKIGSIATLLINAMGLDYTRFYNGIVELEEKYGPLPIFHIPEYFPYEQKVEILKYKLKERMNIGKMISDVWNVLTISEPPNKVIEAFIKSTKASFDSQVEKYLAHFEFIHENFVLPIVNVASDSVIQGYKNRIEFANQVFNSADSSKYPNLPQLSFFIQGMDGTLRNALVHKNYYIKDGTLHYFQTNPWKKVVHFKEKKLEEFEKVVGFIFIQKWIFNIIMGLRIGKIPKEEVKKWSEMKIIKQSSGSENAGESE